MREIHRRRGRRGLCLFLDYDGTLTPIVEDPDRARLSSRARRVLERLASRHPVGLVSGRDTAWIAAEVGIPGIVYAGCHGLDIRGPDGLEMQHESAVAALPGLEALERRLRQALGALDGVRLERKRFCLAVHLRRVSTALRPAVERIVDEHVADSPGWRRRHGKQVLELEPAADWDKGAAARWILAELGHTPATTLPVGSGDDTTDEDLFAALAGWGVTIKVGDAGEAPSRAEFGLPGPDAVIELLARLSGGSREPRDGGPPRRRDTPSRERD